MPDFRKISHLSFSSRDCERSAAWYQEVFGFEPLDRVTEDGWHSILLVHPPTATILEFQQHDANGGETFDPTRTGLDHLGLMVDSRAELEAWVERLDRLGVRHSGVIDREY